MKSFADLKRNLKKDYKGLKVIKIAVLGDSATQFLVQAIKGYGYESGINFDIFEADFNQIERQTLDRGSELYQFRPDFVIIFHSSQKLINSFYKLNHHDKLHFADSHIKSIFGIYDAMYSKLGSKLIYFNLAEINDGVFGNFANKVEISFTYQLRKINYELMNLGRQLRDFYLCDFSLLQSQHGRGFIFEPKIYVNTDLILNIDFLPIISKNIIDIILSIRGVMKKCLIVDLDNTLWGGVLGDDGIENIQIGYLGIGKAYTELQLWIKQLKERGIILAVCSTNDENTAKEAFKKHPDMILRLEDFAIFVVNWDNKVDNIKYIRNVLNISYDSMVFLDDNPFERNLVKTHMPEITVPDLPEDPAEFLEYLHTLNLFETASFSEEDAQRNLHYQTEVKRTMAKLSYDNEDDFLASLGMASKINSFNGFNIPRVTQLVQRSNQFNLRTVRYSEGDVQRIASSDDYFTFSFTLKDKLGDNGLISAVILKKDGQDLFIDTWIMSCRVLKRGMEHFVLNKIVAFAKHHGYAQLIGEYIPSAKNSLVSDHYSKLGFYPHGNYWKLDVVKYKELQTYITESLED